MSTIVFEQRDIASTRLRLRRLRPTDAALVHLYASDPRVARMTTSIPHPYPPGGAEAFIDRTLAPGARELVWALDVGDEAENGLIGLIALNPAADGSAEIGYWVAPAFWNAGYASEAVDALVDEADRFGLVALAAQAFQDNLASVRVLTRAGFAYQGDGELYSVARGGMVPTFRYLKALR
jgi:RimJ/RimL family protein N-acetyltransferase